MPTPALNVLGGVGQVGAAGAGGALEGLVKGEILKRKFQSQDLENQLMELRRFVEQEKARRMNQPTYQASGDRLFTFPAFGGPPQITILPPTPGETEKMNLEKARAARLLDLPPHIQKAWEAYHQQFPDKSYWDFVQEQAVMQHPGRVTIKETTDEKGNVHTRIFDAQGNQISEQVAPAAGKPAAISQDLRRQMVEAQIGRIKSLNAKTAQGGAIGAVAVRELNALRADLNARRMAIMQELNLLSDPMRQSAWAGMTTQQRQARIASLRTNLQDIEQQLQEIIAQRAPAGSPARPGLPTVPAVPRAAPGSVSDPLGIR